MGSFQLFGLLKTIGLCPPPSLAFKTPKLTCPFKYSNSGKWCALKVIQSWATKGSKRIDELSILQRATSANPMHPGYPHVVTLWDHFTHIGPNGDHLCLVMEPLGENLFSLKARLPGYRLSLNLVKKIARQTLLGLDYLHSSCGIIHTGINPTQGCNMFHV